MPYLFFKPDCDFRHCVTRWLEEGGTHHEAVMPGDTRAYWKALAKMLDICYCEI